LPVALPWMTIAVAWPVLGLLSVVRTSGCCAYRSAFPENLSGLAKQIACSAVSPRLQQRVRLGHRNGNGTYSDVGPLGE